MATIADLVSLATQFGVFEFYLPFLILFAIFYGLLTKMKLFGDAFVDENATKGAKGQAKLARAINLILSLAAALFLMAYTPVGLTLTSFFASMFGSTMLILVTLICAGLILYILGRIADVDIFTRDKEGKLPPGFRLAIVLIVLIGLGLFLISGGFGLFGGMGVGINLPSLPSISVPGLNISLEDLLIIALVVITAIAIWWVVKTPGEDKPGAGAK
jgi:hypothetical protein